MDPATVARWREMNNAADRACRELETIDEQIRLLNAQRLTALAAVNKAMDACNAASEAFMDAHREHCNPHAGFVAERALLAQLKTADDATIVATTETHPDPIFVGAVARFVLTTKPLSFSAAEIATAKRICAALAEHCNA